YGATQHFVCFLLLWRSSARQTGLGYKTAWITAWMVVMSRKQEIADFLAREFPQCKCTVEDLGHFNATVRHEVGHAELRPGGTVSGPVLMAVADVALYVAILNEIGIVPLTVTTSLNVNFMRKPAADAAIIGVCKLLKLGRSL